MSDSEEEDQGRSLINQEAEESSDDSSSSSDSDEDEEEEGEGERRVGPWRESCLIERLFR